MSATKFFRRADRQTSKIWRNIF